MAISLLLKSKGSKGLLGREFGRKRFSPVRKTADTWPGEVWISANWACPVPACNSTLRKGIVNFTASLISTNWAHNGHSIGLHSLFISSTKKNKYTIEETILAKINLLDKTWQQNGYECWKKRNQQEEPTKNTKQKVNININICIFLTALLQKMYTRWQPWTFKIKVVKD